MFLIGSPGREASNLRQEAANAPQQSYLARTLPSQERAYHPWPVLAILFDVVNVQVQYTSIGEESQICVREMLPLNASLSCDGQAQGTARWRSPA